jgi:hypothetical protein
LDQPDAGKDLGADFGYRHPKGPMVPTSSLEMRLGDASPVKHWAILIDNRAKHCYVQAASARICTGVIDM